MKSQDEEYEKPKWVIWGFYLITVCFFIQGIFAYTDFPTPAVGTQVELSGEALAGLALWQEMNCQACHQIYGQGGFMGPDLTNVTARYPDEYIHFRLEFGGARMPTLNLPEEDRLALIAFLKAINETGQGTVERLPNGQLPWYTYPTKE